MGAANAIRVYATYGTMLGDHAMRALVYMALVSMDGDAEPWFGLGQEALSELAFGRKVPSADDDPAGREATLKAVRRATAELQKAGAIRTSARARFGAQRSQNARYRLYLDIPCPSARPPLPGRAPDGKRPMVTGEPRPPDVSRPHPPDGKRPMPPDAGSPVPPDGNRPADGGTTGRFVSDHRTKNVRPPDEKRPTKEKEEEEERINDGSVSGATVEGTHEPARTRDKDKVDRSGREDDAAQDRALRPLWPSLTPDPPAGATRDSVSRPRRARESGPGRARRAV